VPWKNVEFLIKHLNPKGLVIRTIDQNRKQVDKLLLNVVKWAGIHKHQKKLCIIQENHP